VEVGGAAHQNGFDVIGVRELADGDVKETVEGDIAEIASAARGEAGPVVGELRRAPEEEVALGAGRARDGSDRSHGEMVRQRREK